MSSIAGPLITNNGLVFGYDTGYGISNNDNNTRYSKGEPTTNLITGTGNPYLSTTGWSENGWSGDINVNANIDALELTSTNGWHDINYDFGVLNQSISIRFLYKLKSKETEIFTVM